MSRSKRLMFMLHLWQSRPLTTPVTWQWSTTSIGFGQSLHFPPCSLYISVNISCDRLYFCMRRLFWSSGTQALHHICLGDAGLNHLEQCSQAFSLLSAALPMAAEINLDWLKHSSRPHVLRITETLPSLFLTILTGLSQNKHVCWHTGITSRRRFFSEAGFGSLD